MSSAYRPTKMTRANFYLGPAALAYELVPAPSTPLNKSIAWYKMKLSYGLDMHVCNGIKSRQNTRQRKEQTCYSKTSRAMNNNKL